MGTARRSLLVVLGALALATPAALAAPAQSAAAAEGVYYQDPVTADRPVPTPPTPSCTSTLATDYVTNAPDGTPQSYNGTFDPPAGCPGPWARVVLDLTGQEAGRQFDRAGEITMGGARIFFTSTPEPDPDGIVWHAQKDVTEYTSLFTAGQPYTIDIPNYTSDFYTGVMHISATLTFYQADAAHPAPRTPDRVIGLPSRDLSSGSDVATWTVSDLPRNITRAELEVYPKGNACDEFWYGGLPDDFAAAHPDAGLCGGGPYREIDASLDGTPAGATIPFPNIFTGGVNPLIWRPIPAVDAFNLEPRTMDLTPFAGTLVDGADHQLAMSIRGAQSYWSLRPNLLLYTDAGATQTTGAVTQNTLPDSPTAITDSESTGSTSVRYTLQAGRTYTVSGWVQTSAGRVTTTVRQALSFQNSNTFELQNFRQNTTNDQTLDSTVTTVDDSGTHDRHVVEQDPVRAQDMFNEPPHADHWMLPAHVTATKDVTVRETADGDTTYESGLSNTTAGSGVLSEYDDGQYRLADGSDEQTYDYADSTGACYHHRIKAAQGWVTSDRLDTSC